MPGDSDPSHFRDNGDRTARRAIWALFFISLAGIAGGVAVAYFGQPVGGIIAVVSGAIGGIVAIVLRQTTGQ